MYRVLETVQARPETKLVHTMNTRPEAQSTAMMHAARWANLGTLMAPTIICFILYIIGAVKRYELPSNAK